ncbi:MAG: hypothetical protein Fur0020_08790 [Thermodesulfovibrionia bacterium]
MLTLVMKSKIHKAIVTEVDPDYIDSITIDEDLMERADLKEYERVLVVSNTTGARLETFVVKGERGSGAISVNGPVVHHIKEGHEITIMAFTWSDEDIKPRSILVDERNGFIKYLEGGEF